MDNFLFIILSKQGLGLDYISSYLRFSISSMSSCCFYGFKVFMVLFCQFLWQSIVFHFKLIQRNKNVCIFYCYWCYLEILYMEKYLICSKLFGIKGNDWNASVSLKVGRIGFIKSLKRHLLWQILVAVWLGIQWLCWVSSNQTQTTVQGSSFRTNINSLKHAWSVRIELKRWNLTALIWSL